MAERTCTVCSTALEGRQVKYCSQSCASRAYLKTRLADGRIAEQHRKYAKERAVWQKANSGRYKERVQCPVCLATREVRRGGAGKYCSISCRSAAVRSGAEPATIRKLNGSPKRSTLARRKLRKAARGTTGKGNRWVQGPCRRCGVQFVALGNGPGLASFCSDQCRSADRRARYRARRVGAFVSMVYRSKIYDRDDWRCQLCGKPVRRGKSVPHPLAPTIDHIVPLADGGNHEPSNVQCAHFICNSRKSAGAANDQLRLIG